MLLAINSGGITCGVYAKRVRHRNWATHPLVLRLGRRHPMNADRLKTCHRYLANSSSAAVFISARISEGISVSLWRSIKDCSFSFAPPMASFLDKPFALLLFKKDAIGGAKEKLQS